MSCSSGSSVGGRMTSYPAPNDSSILGIEATEFKCFFV